MLQALNEAEQVVEAEKKLNIFETAVDLDVSCGHNLYFKNPSVQQGDISFKREYVKYKNTSYNNIRIALFTRASSELESLMTAPPTQGWLQQSFFNLTSIT